MPDFLCASYVPFTKEEADGIIVHAAVNISNPAHFHGDGETPLSTVGKFKTLYVVAHGNGGASTVSASASGGGETLSPTELADRIEGDGLQKSHKKLKLVACKGYQFAKDLKKALLDNGYTHLKVYGYTETLEVIQSPGRIDYHKFARDDKGNPLGRAKKYRKKA